MSRKPKIVIFTIGHSTHPLNEFLSLLQHYAIAHLIDIRTLRGIEVQDIFSQTSAKPHTLTSFAKVRGKKITYPS
jgi:hypothetical protein